MNLINQNGVSFVETLIVLFVTAVLVGGGAVALNAGRSSWFFSEAEIQTQENLRKALDNMTTELRQTRNANLTITAGAGASGSDTVSFSIPVICHTGDNIINSNGDIAHWGATLKWNDRSASSMDADNNCGTVDYAKIKYILKSGNVLARQVLDNSSTVVREDKIGNNISNIHLSLIGTPTQGIHIDLTSSTSVTKRQVNLTIGTDVIFRNQ